MSTLSEIVMIFNNESWDFATKYVYGSDSLKKLFTYCMKPLQESDTKSVLLHMSDVPWSESMPYVTDYLNLLSALQEQSEKSDDFKYLVARTDRATEGSDLVGNYGDHPFFAFNWDGLEYEFSNNWFIYSPNMDDSLANPYASMLPQNAMHRLS
jgi:hypothetical protein